MPAGTEELVMEVDVPDGLLDQNVLFLVDPIPRLERAELCELEYLRKHNTDRRGATLGFPTTHCVFNVNGVCGTDPTAKAVNLSTRLRVELGKNAMIGGFIINGTAPKSVVLRGMGPSLAGAGIPDVLANPFLELHGSDGALLFTNNDWMDDPAQAVRFRARFINQRTIRQFVS